LAVVFRDRSEARTAERNLATDILADYAADRPDVLADLLLDADPKQYARLYPRVQERSEQARPLLRVELDRQAQPGRWADGPLDPAWSKPGEALVRQLETAQGLLAERFAFCQTMPLEAFVQVAEQLRPCGYRPVRVRPYVRSDRIHAVGAGPGPAEAGHYKRDVAAVWSRDGRPWQMLHGVSADDIRQQDTELRKQGYQPVDVAGYLDGDQEHYAAAWARADKDDEARLYAGVPEKQYKTATESMAKATLRPVALQTFVGADGEVRYSAVFRKMAPEGSSFWNDDEATHADRGLSDGLPVDICLIHSRQYVRDAQAEVLGWLSGAVWVGLYLRTQGEPELPHPERRYAGCFLGDAAFDHVSLLGLTPEQQLQRGRELAAQGYRPAALSVSEARFLKETGFLVSAAVWHRPVVPEDAKEHLARRQASAAAALVQLGQAGDAWPVLRQRPDPRARSHLIERLNLLGADPQALWRRFTEEPNVSIRRALLLALGDFGDKELPPAERDRLQPHLFELYRTDPDPGLHGAAACLLTHWGQRAKLRDIDQELAARDKDVASGGRQPPEGRRWYINGQGQTMILIPGPVEFMMGFPRTEAEREGGPEGAVERPHRRRIGRSFALAAHEVTVDQFLRFRKDHGYSKQYARTPDSPVNVLTWYDAAAYCNWLSEQERIPKEQWCYEPNAKGQYAEGMRAKPGYLDLTGYRLPSEAEWEYACRAGTVTARYYGETEEQLGRYGWYTKVSGDKALLPVGELRPNDWGFFDLLGNDVGWCHDRIFYYPRSRFGRVIEDREYIGYIIDRQSRVLRGGAFTNHARIVRAALRLRNAPANQNNDAGVRAARTYP
jgi:formylglycine-generating enzyme required for sulfatase activity